MNSWEPNRPIGVFKSIPLTCPVGPLCCRKVPLPKCFQSLHRLKGRPHEIRNPHPPLPPVCCCWHRVSLNPQPGSPSWRQRLRYEKSKYVSSQLELKNANFEIQILQCCTCSGYYFLISWLTTFASSRIVKLISTCLLCHRAMLKLACMTVHV